MKLSVWILLAATLSHATPGYADESRIAQGNWVFRHADGTGENAATCSLSASAEPGTGLERLQIEASPAKPIVAFTHGPLRKGGTISWDVDGMQAAYFEIGDNNRMTPFSLKALSALAAGEKLEVSADSKNAGTFSLKGSAVAIEEFMECWTGSNNSKRAGRAQGSHYIHGAYSDLAIMSDELSSVAPTIRRDAYGDDFGAYFVPVAHDGKVVTKAYLFIFKDTEKAGHLVAISTLTRNAAGDVDTALDDEVAGSCVESDANIECYGVGYGQLEFRLGFAKQGQPYTAEDYNKNAIGVEKRETAAALTEDQNIPLGKNSEKQAEESTAEPLGRSAIDAAARDNNDNNQLAELDTPGAGTGYINPNRNFKVEAFGEFTSMTLEGRDLIDVAGKKLVRTINHFTNPETHTPIGQYSETVTYREQQGYHYQFEIKNRFDAVGEDTGTKVKFNLEEVHEDNGSLRSTITSVETLARTGLKRQLRTGGFEVEQGYCVENEPMDSNSPSTKTVECKGISTKGERFGFTFVRDKEFAPKVTEWDVREEQQAHQKTRAMLEERERERLENLERMRNGDL